MRNHAIAPTRHHHSGSSRDRGRVAAQRLRGLVAAQRLKVRDRQARLLIFLDRHALPPDDRSSLAVYSRHRE
jgi:hypothetical protein